MNKRGLAILFFLAAAISIKLRAQVTNYPALNFTLQSRISPETGSNSDGNKYSGCWGWHQAATNKEYAIACSQSGTYWVDVSNPFTPTVCAYRAGVQSGTTWREAKTYLNYCYVISDDPGNNSFQIFDMQYLPDSVHKVYDSQALFKRGHTLWVDGNKLYVASVTYSDNSYHSMEVFSLANPTQPSLLRSLDQDYPFINQVHDMYVRNDTVYASCAYQGLYVFKFISSTSTFTMLGSLTTYNGSGYNHSSSLSSNGKTLVFTDEIPAGLPIKVANVNNLANIQVLATSNQYAQTTPHNPFVVGNQFCFMSSYQEGLQLYDISSPASPSLVAYFDTYPQGGGNVNNWSSGPYMGQWGCYPYFPSKNIFALDQFSGLFMLGTHLYTNNLVNVKHLDADNVPLKIFPNPSSGLVYIKVNSEKNTGAFEVKVSNLYGKIVLDENHSQEDAAEVLEIKTGDWASGIYFFELISGGRVVSTQKIALVK